MRGAGQWWTGINATSHSGTTVVLRRLSGKPNPWRLAMAPRILAHHSRAPQQ